MREAFLAVSPPGTCFGGGPRYDAIDRRDGWLGSHAPDGTVALSRTTRPDDPRFEWDEAKARANAKKHGVTSEEASSVFADPLAAIFTDEAHSDQEVREIIVGHSAKGHLLVTSFTERGEAIRIISVRQATTRERRDYERRPIG